jgi:3-oxoadipate enol-lactonase
MLAHINGTEINFEIEGLESAPVVTFSHSLAATLDMWELQVVAMRDYFRVLRFDTRGHGKSSIPSDLCTMETLSDDVVGLLDYLDIQRTHFVGLSMGGMIGQVLALQYPHRLNKLVLCDTTGSVPAETAPIWAERIHTAETRGMSVLAQETLERWLSDGFRQSQPGISEGVRNMIVQTPVPGYVACCKAISHFNVLEKLSGVTLPTLIMVGEHDLGTPVSAAEAIHERVQDSKLIIVPGALHLTNIENATFFTEKLLGFLG